MTIKEKTAYLRGLAEGMDIEATEQGKFYSAVIDILDDIADEIEELNENALDIGEELDAISDDLADVEDFLEELDLDDDYDNNKDSFCADWDDWGDEDDEYFDALDSGGLDDDDDDDNDYAGCGGCGGDDNVEYTIDVNCPECNAEIELDENDIANEYVDCPVCRKIIELEIDEVDVDD